MRVSEKRTLFVCAPRMAYNLVVEVHYSFCPGRNTHQTLRKIQTYAEEVF
jgi:hypothetical protein